MIEHIRRHIESRLSAIKIEKFPFPHAEVDDFFPSDVYEKILQYNPFKKNIGVEWISKASAKAIKTETPYYARKQINFHHGQEFAGDAEEKEFWQIIKSTFLQDNWFENLIYSKYADYFDIRFGELVQEPNFFGRLHKELFLQRHDSGYYIGPHTDVPTRVFTCIFSFADRPGFEEFGTQIVRHHDPLARCWGHDHYRPDEFEVVKTASYKPNNFFLFFKTRQSFHAVKAIDDTVPNQRYGMQFQLYEPHGGLFNDLSEPNIMRRIRPKKTVLQKISEKLSK